MRKVFLRHATVIIGCALLTACVKQDPIGRCSPPDSDTKTLVFPGGMPAILLRSFRQYVGDIAAPGENFDTTDVVRVGRNRRVIFVWNRGAEYVIATEQGGIVYNNPVFLYRIDPQNSAARLESEKVTFPASVCAVSRRLLGAR